ncbi:polysaccharide biosynthesis protein [Granulicella sp. S190]|uniref:polysaccharide biosynthesis protein n=1 Tax=Granulicella sp. S190 TaxID=1747226 RepID=UPI00131BB229|nr:polysaccharide biosynthesis protein [Granulicella sp. S190]
MLDETIDWTKFLGRVPDANDPEIFRGTLESKRVLITGAGGYIGSALARCLDKASLQHLTLLDIGEQGLFELSAELDDREFATPRVQIVGDVCDVSLLDSIFERYRPQIVFHAAACKHVPLMETNPFTAARSNILGTHRLLTSANRADVEQIVVISTDKAVDPVSVMGVTKRVGELLVQGNRGPTRVKAVRLANVLGSTGSVGPIFARQIARGIPISITDEDCTRYFLSVEEVIPRLVTALAVEKDSVVLISETGKPLSIVSLANFLIQDAQLTPGSVRIKRTGLRPGDKLTESMIAIGESVSPSNVALLHIVSPDHAPSTAMLNAAIEEIEAAINYRDLRRLLDTITRVVPEYRPSPLLQRHADVERQRC